MQQLKNLEEIESAVNQYGEIVVSKNSRNNVVVMSMEEYKKRLNKYTKLEIIELNDEKDDDIKSCLQKEKDNILNHIKEKDNLVILDILGTEYTSVEFSKFLEKELTTNSNITFLIGSSNGLSDEIKKLTNKKISFSKLTFPHQLFRIILLEQIYRGFKIINNESYHK